MHDWIELYNQNSSVGVYRVTNPVTDFNQQLTLTLRHGIDCLADAVLEAQEDYKGAPQALLTRLLNAQKTLVNGVKPWVLGTCAATDDIDVNINYPRLSELLNTIEGQLEGYLITYDQTVFPWVLSVIEKPSTVDAEFRLNRNVQTLSRTLNDNEMCTQLILSINSKTVKAGVTGTDTIIKTYDNAEAQQRWGIIQKTADIDTSDTLTGDNVTTPEADAWAARFLRDHAAPSVQMQITGYELSRITGDTWDETKLGHICRVAVPKYNQSFDERIVAITYPDALGQPDSVTVSLANQLPKFSSAIASLKKEAARAGGAARRAGRDKADADEMQTWSQTVQYYGLALDGTGVMTLYESGIDMNPVGGVTIYSLEEGLQALYGGIQVNSQAITLKVSKGEVGTQLAVECGNVHISGTPGSANLIVDGYVEATDIFSASGTLHDIYSETIHTQDAAINGDANVGGDLSVDGGLSVALANTVTCGNIACGNVDCDGIAFNGGTVYSAVVVDANVDSTTNTLTLTKSNGQTVNFSKAASPENGTITSLVQSAAATYSPTASGGYYTVHARASGTNLTNTGGYYDKDLIVMATAAYQAGEASTTAYQDGYAAGVAEFTSAGTVYLRKTGGSIRVGSSRTIHQRGTAIYFKSHPRTETPTSLWYSMVGSATEATQTYYTLGSDITAYPSSSSGTYYYLSDGTATDLYRRTTT